MHKLELIKVVATRADLSQKVSQAVVDAFINAVTTSLVQGQKVRLRGLGTFEIRPRAASVGRNPHTGSLITLAANKRVYFKASKYLKGEALTGQDV